MDFTSILPVALLVAGSACMLPREWSGLNLLSMKISTKGKIGVWLGLFSLAGVDAAHIVLASELPTVGFLLVLGCVARLVARDLGRVTVALDRDRLLMLPYRRQSSLGRTGP